MTQQQIAQKAFSHQRSAHQHSAISTQPSAFSHQHSAVSIQPVAFRGCSLLVRCFTDASSRSPAFLPAGRGISRAPPTQPARDPSLRLNAGSAKDDPTTNRTKSIQPSALSRQHSASRVPWLLLVSPLLHGCVIPKPRVFTSGARDLACSPMQPARDPSLRLNAGSAKDDPTTNRTKSIQPSALSPSAFSHQHSAVSIQPVAFRGCSLVSPLLHGCVIPKPRVFTSGARDLACTADAARTRSFAPPERRLR